jgi:hypothetical protein
LRSTGGVDLHIRYVDLHRRCHLADLSQRADQITGSLLVWENGGSNAPQALILWPLWSVFTAIKDPDLG